jgi:hypothetical protein
MPSAAGVRAILLKVIPALFYRERQPALDGSPFRTSVVGTTRRRVLDARHRIHRIGRVFLATAFRAIDVETHGLSMIRPSGR